MHPFWMHRIFAIAEPRTGKNLPIVRSNYSYSRMRPRLCDACDTTARNHLADLGADTSVLDASSLDVLRPLLQDLSVDRSRGVEVLGEDDAAE